MRCPETSENEQLGDWVKLGAREELSALRPQLLANDIARPVIKHRINSSDVVLKGDVLAPPETPLRSFEKFEMFVFLRLVSVPLAQLSQMAR